MRSGSPNKLICFDFDNVIVNGHLYNNLVFNEVVPRYLPYGNDEFFIINHQLINNSTFKQHEKYDNLIEIATSLNFAREYGIVGGQKLNQLFQKLISNGFHIAIVTSDIYTSGIEAILLDYCGLTDRQLKKIPIISGFPKGSRDSNNRIGRNRHLEHAMEIFGISSPSDVIYIGHNIKFATVAERDGYLVILTGRGRYLDFDRFPSYIDRIINSNMINKENSLKLNHSIKQSNMINDNRLLNTTTLSIGENQLYTNGDNSLCVPKLKIPKAIAIPQVDFLKSIEGPAARRNLFL